MQVDKNTPLGRSVAAAEPPKSQHAAAKWNALIDDTLVLAPQRVVRTSLLLEQADVAADKVLVRDHGSDEDVAMGNGEQIDLAQGNVFYVVDMCDAPPKRKCTKPAKLALFVDDRPEVTLNPNQTGRTIRELFGLREDVNLLRDYESLNDEPVGATDAAPFERGPVFITRRQHEKLTIKVNNQSVQFAQHRVTALQLKREAIDQGVKIDIDNVVYPVKPDGSLGPAIRDDEKIILHECDAFNCVAPDDKS